MSSTETTISEMIDSLTGFEEIAISKHFGEKAGTLLADEGSTLGGRALIFTDLVRKGAPAPEAKDQALNLRLGEVNTYFADEPDDVNPEEPDSDSGKGE